MCALIGIQGLCFFFNLSCMRFQFQGLHLSIIHAWAYCLSPQLLKYYLCVWLPLPEASVAFLCCSPTLDLSLAQSVKFRVKARSSISMFVVFLSSGHFSPERGLHAYLG